MRQAREPIRSRACSTRKKQLKYHFEYGGSDIYEEQTFLFDCQGKRRTVCNCILSGISAETDYRYLCPGNSSFYDNSIAVCIDVYIAQDFGGLDVSRLGFFDRGEFSPFDAGTI